MLNSCYISTVFPHGHSGVDCVPKGDGCLQPAGSPNESDFWISSEDFWNLAHVEKTGL